MADECCGPDEAASGDQTAPAELTPVWRIRELQAAALAGLLLLAGLIAPAGSVVETVLFWAAGLLFFALLARRLSPLHGFLLLFGVEIAADAYLTGGLTPLAGGTTAATLASVLFVILGDLR